MHCLKRASIGYSCRQWRWRSYSFDFWLRDAFRGWIAVEDVLQMKRKNDRGWVPRSRKVWDDYLKTDPIVVDFECPCWGAGSSSFLEHLMKRHLGWLFHGQETSNKR